LPKLDILPANELEMFYKKMISQQKIGVLFLTLNKNKH